MKHSVAILMTVALGLSVVTLAQQDGRADALRYRNQLYPVDSTVAILVNGTPQPQYTHNGRLYVEALKGKEYAIQMRNPYPVRVAVALSVDGLNTIDASHMSAADARKWVLGPHETVTISGWQVNQAQARRFEFTTEPKSYAQALGKTDNLGVITAVFFKERPAKMTRQEYARPTAPPAPTAANPGAVAESAADASSARALSNEYAATGMGQRTDHAVTTVWLDLESKPAQTVNIRYEYHDQLVSLGIAARRHRHAQTDPMTRRERARGFEGFAPELPTR
jgi:hypothetical protein